MFRIAPSAPAGAYKTYQILAPAQTHYRPGTCVEVRCEAYLGGWRTVVDETTDLGQKQAHYIRHDRTRRHVEEQLLDGRTSFWFGPGQVCFRAGEHRVRLDRPEIYVVRGGDWRGNPGGQRRQHANAADWVDDFAEHQDRLKTAVEKG